MAVGGESHITSLAAARASTWFPQLEPVSAEVVRVYRKRHSTVHELLISGSHGDARVFVKEAKNRDGERPSRRPHSIAEQAVGSKAGLQADALDDLHRAVDRIRDPFIGSVRVLDHVDDYLVLSSAAGEPLRDRVLDHVRWHRRGRIDLVPVFARAGRLLRTFHDEVRRPAAARALGRREEVVSCVRAFSDHLNAVVTSPEDVRRLEARLIGEVERHLPAELEGVALFGDFGLTNLLVTDAGAVTAIDTLAARRAPPLHDATYLSTGLLAVRPQVMTHGRAIAPSVMHGWEDAFWAGYLGDREAPVGAIAVWSGIRLLERWSAKTTRAGWQPTRRLRGAVVDGYMTELVRRALADAESATAAPALVAGLVSTT